MFLYFFAKSNRRLIWYFVKKCFLHTCRPWKSTALMLLHIVWGVTLMPCSFSTFSAKFFADWNRSFLICNMILISLIIISYYDGSSFSYFTFSKEAVVPNFLNLYIILNTVQLGIPVFFSTSRDVLPCFTRSTTKLRWSSVCLPLPSFY